MTYIDIAKQPNNHHALIVGLGRSGFEAAMLCLEQGMRVTVSDNRPAEQLETYSRKLSSHDNITLDLGTHTIRFFEEADVIILSPGVPDTIDALQAAKSKHIPIVGDLEWASLFIEAPIIAITGTNGKTTTTALTGHLFGQCGYKTFIGGNIGIPLSCAVNKEYDVIILECSSFQLETIKHFSPQYTALLNVTPDHLDRYPSMEHYQAAKQILFDLQSEDSYCVTNADDPRAQQITAKTNGHIYSFGTSKSEITRGIVIHGDQAQTINLPHHEDCSIDLSHPVLKGTHNRQNAAAALLLCLLHGVKRDALMSAYTTFTGVPHRLEPITTINNITFYNDSKATNDDAAATGIKAFSEPIFVLLGGKDKGTGYHAVANACHEKHIKQAICYGDAGPIIQECLKDICKTSIVNDLFRATMTAWDKAESGDVILLSPACSSFDQYKNYEERGDHFRKIVQTIKDKYNE